MTLTPGPSSKKSRKSAASDVNGFPLTKTYLSTLPEELLLEIASWYPRVDLPITIDAFGHGTFPGRFSAAEHNVRVQCLRTLSQTCRRLRSLYAPFAWERVEADCDMAEDDNRTEGERLKLLMKKLKGLVKCTWIHPMLRHLSASLKFCTNEDCEPVVLLVRALKRLPNLDSLWIIDSPPLGTTRNAQVSSIIWTAFESHTFCSVQSLALPLELLPVARSFPSIRRIAMTGGMYAGCASWRIFYGRDDPDDGDSCVVDFFSTCQDLEEMLYVYPSRFMLSKISRLGVDSERLRRLTFSHSVFNSETIASLSTLPHLTSLQLKTERPITVKTVSSLGNSSVKHARALNLERLSMRYYRCPCDGVGQADDTIVEVPLSDEDDEYRPGQGEDSDDESSALGFVPFAVFPAVQLSLTPFGLFLV